MRSRDGVRRGWERSHAGLPDERRDLIPDRGRSLVRYTQLGQGEVQHSAEKWETGRFLIESGRCARRQSCSLLFPRTDGEDEPPGQSVIINWMEKQRIPAHGLM